MFNLRQANLQDLEALIQLRLDLLREAGDIKGDSDTANLAEATRKWKQATFLKRHLLLPWR
jgi:hypothetical protein